MFGATFLLSKLEMLKNKKNYICRKYFNVESEKYISNKYFMLYVQLKNKTEIIVGIMFSSPFLYLFENNYYATKKHPLRYCCI